MDRGLDGIGVWVDWIGDLGRLENGLGRLDRGLAWIEDSSSWEGYACGRSLLGGGLGVGGFLRGMGTAAFCFLFGRAGKKEKQGVVSGWTLHPGLTGGGVFKAGLELGREGYPVVCMFIMI